MKELHIQAEVGRRLREVLGRSYKRRALTTNSRFHWNKGDVVFNDDGGKNDDIPALIDQLIEAGHFTSADKTGLQALRPEAIRTLVERLGTTDESDEVEPHLNASYEDFVHAHRPKAMRRELPEVRASRNAQTAQRAFRVNGIEDEIAIGMLPPSSRRARS